MYEGFEIIDFHSHFPTDRPWFPDMGETTAALCRAGQRGSGAALMQEQSKPYQRTVAAHVGLSPGGRQGAAPGRP
jgi:hypothetical protein